MLDFAGARDATKAIAACKETDLKIAHYLPGLSDLRSHAEPGYRCNLEYSSEIPGERPWPRRNELLPAYTA